ncbi:pyridoxal phosphate-dependent aminotransferase [bacterium]|nr:pyridoxal phosphate-dependent aminotransferase [bacterium]
MKFARRMSKLKGVASLDMLAKATRLQEEGRDIIHMEVGEPDFNTPKNIKLAGEKAIKDNYTHYSPAAGFSKLRKIIAEYESNYKGINIDPAEIVITSGAKPIMYYAITLFAQLYDEVIFPDPGYPVYKSIIKFTGARPVSMPLIEDNNFGLDRVLLKASINSNTKMIILNTPGNPTGSILSKNDIEFIADLAIEKDLVVLSDEIYSRIIYKNKFFSIYSIPEMRERTIILNGLSKTYAMTGWRLGWGIMPPEISKIMIRLNANITSCASTISQMAAVEALLGSQNEITKMCEKFTKRRNYIVKRLNKMRNVHVQLPEGAFYVFPNIKETGRKSAKIAEYLLDDAGIALLPGSGFGHYGEGYLRISYATSMENIKKAMDRMEKSMAKLEPKRKRNNREVYRK